MIPTLEQISKTAKIHPFKIKGCYIFGSRVYLTNSPESDWDIILVANNSVNEVEIKTTELNIHVITPDAFSKLVEDNHIKAIECLFAPSWAILKPFDIEFTYKPASFRHNVSQTVSNSWVKARKKIELENEPHIGIKSLFHSLRIANFGIQFAKTGKIDFTAMNDVWKDISTSKVDWKEFKDKYQPLRNELLTEFRKVCS